MRKHPVGIRYATAMFEIATEKDVLSQTAQELELVLKVVEDSNAQIEVFKHPKMTNAQKKDFVKEAFSKDVSQDTLNLLYVLIDNGRINDLFHVVDNFKELVDEQQGVAEAIVTSVKPLSDEEKQAINDVFSKKAGKEKLRIENVVDKDIIGGIKVRIGDRVYDGSIARQLEKIQKTMIYGNVSR